MEPQARLPFMLGLGATFVGTMLVMMCVGFTLSSHLPPLLAACLVFLTPAYFLVGLLAGARERIDYLSIAGGAALFGLFHVAIPEFDLVLAGVIGGTLAFALSRWQTGKQRDG